jgi:intracellular sulfur oxidation DsrE/DsrF family protein
MIVVINSTERFEDKLKSVLDNAELLGKNAMSIMVDEVKFNDVIKFMSNHKNIEKVVMGGEVLFMIKHMRIEIKAVNFYI